VSFSRPPLDPREVVRCVACRTANRLPSNWTGVAKCGECGSPLPIASRPVVDVASNERSVITRREYSRLISDEGLDIPSSELRVLADGTLAYKNARVLLYIRDITIYGTDRDERPRFHVADCHTLRQMRSGLRFDRYVVSVKTDGKFKLNIFQSGKSRRSETVQLDVCQHCLGSLHFDGFRTDMPNEERGNRVTRFSLTDFFRKYPISLHKHTPRYNSEDAPENTYAANISEISRRERAAVGWTCQCCGVVLSDPNLRQYLHLHHVNGQKYDNSRENLRVLCVECHAEQPSHSHVKRTGSYVRFRELADSLRKRRG
jgi:hypothetical protein